MSQETIQPIINGSFNPRLTKEDFLSLPFEQKRSYVWSVIVSMGFAHCFSEADHRVFFAHPDKDKESWKFDQITPESVDTLFDEVREAHRAHRATLLNKTSSLHYELGQKIYEAQRELGFGGIIQLDRYRMKGYIGACGDWNDFKASAVSVAIGRMHELAPRKDYGPNNPNTGHTMHTLKTVHGCEYVIMEFGFVDEKEVPRILEFYKNQWEPKGNSIKADSIRYELTDHGHGYYGVELIWWWD
jgi:hypothetical protein